MNGTIKIVYTAPNGNETSVQYEVPKADARPLFEDLKSEAWHRSVYMGIVAGKPLPHDASHFEGDDDLSRQASYYTPEVK